MVGGGSGSWGGFEEVSYIVEGICFEEVLVQISVVLNILKQSLGGC